MILEIGFSAEDKAHSPWGFGYVSTYSISLRVTKLKMKVFSLSTTIIISFLNLTFMMSWLALKVISVLFFFSWSSQITTLFLCCSYTNTITFVLYIISTIAMFVFRSCTFFFDRVLPESFCKISKPVSVAIAKYSWVWFDDVPFTVGWAPVGYPYTSF